MPSMYFLSSAFVTSMVSTASAVVPKYLYIEVFCSAVRLAPKVTTFALSALAVKGSPVQVSTAAIRTGIILFMFFIMSGV